MNSENDIRLRFGISFYVPKREFLFTKLGESKKEYFSVSIKKINGLKVVTKNISPYRITFLVVDDEYEYLNFYRSLIQNYLVKGKYIYYYSGSFYYNKKSIDLADKDFTFIYENPSLTSTEENHNSWRYIKDINNTLSKIVLKKSWKSIKPEEFQKINSYYLEGAIKKEYCGYSNDIDIKGIDDITEIEIQNCKEKLLIPYVKTERRSSWEGKPVIYYFHTVPDEKLEIIKKEIESFTEKINISNFKLFLFSRDIKKYYEFTTFNNKELKITSGKNSNFVDYASDYASYSKYSGKYDDY